MRHFALMSGVIAVSLIVTADVNAQSAGTVSPPDPATATASATEPQEAEAAEAPETPEETAYQPAAQSNPGM